MLGKVKMFLNPDPNPAILAISGEILRLSAQTLAQASATSNAIALAQMRNPLPAGEGIKSVCFGSDFSREGGPACSNEYLWMMIYG